MSDTPPAGWYPQQDGAERYWDGTDWTDHVRWPEGAQLPPPGWHPQNDGTERYWDGAR